MVLKVGMVVLLGTAAFAQTRMHARHSHRTGFGGFPLFAGEYDYAPAPSLVLVQPSPLYVMVPEAPVTIAPAKSEIREYPKPTAEAKPSTDDQPAFAIVLSDGTVHSAIAVTVQGRSLYYVDPDGGHRLVSLNTVDREATVRLNRERKLQLQLPPST